MIYRAMNPEEADPAMHLVRRVFDQSVGPDYSKEGREEFLSYAASGEQLLERLSKGHRALVAVEGDEIVGVIETRDARHISLFFVDGPRQRRGIGKALLRAAFDCGALDGAAEITVNAGPRSVSAYERFGFRVTGPEQVKNGIRFVSMVYRGPAGGGVVPAKGQSRSAA